MTSTITAESRAEQLAVRLLGRALNSEAIALIAAAIRDAEDAAYERAATMMDEGPLDTEKYRQGVVVRASFEEISERIREFKSPSPPKDQG